MSKIHLLSLAAALSLTLIGCATPVPHATLTYETSPEGATLYEGTTSLGVAPVTRTYTFDPSSQTMATPEVTAVWPSGAKTTYWTKVRVRADLLATIERPAGAPDLAKDLANAQPFIAAKNAEVQRKKDELRHAIAKDSAACQAQMSPVQVCASPGHCYYPPVPPMDMCN